MGLFLEVNEIGGAITVIDLIDEKPFFHKDYQLFYSSVYAQGAETLFDGASRTFKECGKSAGKKSVSAATL
jgi:hypothetical protein